MEDLKTTILQLEAKLQRKDDELQARTQSFQEALAREQERSADRENKETARRNELNAKVLALTEERAQMKSQLANLQEIEEEAARREQELKIARRELVEFRVKSQDERKSLEEQLAEKRRAQERHRQEVSDLRCHISVLEHRLQHSQSKVATQDAHTDSLSKAQEEIRLLKEEKGNIERTLKTETARFAKDRKALEERAEQALNELRDLKSGPSRVELCAKYESQLDELRWITLDALQLVHRPGGPTPPTDASDPVALRAYVDSVAAHTRAHSFRLASNRGTSFAARRQAASPPQSPTHHQQAQQQQHQQQPPPSPSMPELESLAVSEDDIAVGLIAEAADLLVSLRQTLNLIPEEKQVALLRRFNDTVHAHAGETVSPGRGFGVTSGLPSVRDEPAALVNHIALLTHERDTLKSQLQIATEDLEATRQQLAAKQASASNNTSKSNLNSPPRDNTTPQKKEDPPKSKDESSPQATRPPPAAATADKPSPSSRRQAPSTNPPPLLSARRGNVGGGARA